MTLIQRIRLQKSFADWCRLHRVPAKKYPAYAARVFAIYSAVMLRGGCRSK
jgi:hypothetical protein